MTRATWNVSITLSNVFEQLAFLAYFAKTNSSKVT
jgi:hypothetical protein